jgi:ubiquinone/menaquinone biosynthesis C-methylase UbiE
MKTLLHVGCGPQDKSEVKGFNNDNWNEIRLDIDKDVNPDIVGTLTDLNLVETASVDAVYSAFNIDHIYPHEVPVALKEFYRVLKDDGIVVITCPDMQGVCEAIAEDKLLETLYESVSGPISPIDVLFGNRREIAEGNEYMAKKGGFTYSTLDRVFFEAGFMTRVGGRREGMYELFLVAFKQEKSNEEIQRIAIPFIPKPQH